LLGAERAVLDQALDRRRGNSSNDVLIVEGSALFGKTGGLARPFDVRSGHSSDSGFPSGAM
jgi:hypothetical protein